MRVRVTFSYTVEVEAEDEDFDGAEDKAHEVFGEYLLAPNAYDFAMHDPEQVE